MEENLNVITDLDGTRFGLPVYDEFGEIVSYNIFKARMLVRCDKDGKLYLYDFVRTKKETSKPHE